MLDILRQRELYSSSERRVRSCLSSNVQLLQRMELQRKLQGHSGCVNTVSFDTEGGNVLISGSDDENIILWDWQAGIKHLTFDSGHHNNVFQARMIPNSSGTRIVTCAADGQVRLAELPDGASSESVATSLLGQHGGRAHKLALDPLNPAQCFYSCGEDGQVMHYDLRCLAGTRPTGGSSSSRNSGRRKLLICRGYSHARGPSNKIVGLNAIHCNPARPWQFAVGGCDSWARVYDCRRTTYTTASVGPPTRDQARDSRVYQLSDEPVAGLCPQHMRRSQGSGSFGGDPNITCVIFSKQGELVATYNDEDIYLFSSEATNGCLSSSSSSSSDHDLDQQSQQQQQQQQGRRARLEGASSSGGNMQRLSPSRRRREHLETDGTAATAAAAGSSDGDLEQQQQGKAAAAAAAEDEQRPRWRRRQLLQTDYAAADAAPAPATAAAAAPAPVPAGKISIVDLTEPDNGEAQLHPQQQQQQQQRRLAATAPPAAAAAPAPAGEISNADLDDLDDKEAQQQQQQQQRLAATTPPPAATAAAAATPAAAPAPAGEISIADLDDLDDEEAQLHPQQQQQQQQQRLAAPAAPAAPAPAGEISIADLDDSDDEEAQLHPEQQQQQQQRLAAAAESAHSSSGHGIPAAKFHDRNSYDKDGVVASFYGHRNAATVKGVSFFGANDEYIVTGSDCGHVYIWNKYNGEVIWCQKGDEEVVNCLEPHPYLPHVLATSGIEHDIKIWGPTAPRPATPSPHMLQRLMSSNKRDREAGRAVMAQPEQWLLQLLATQRRREMSRQRARRAFAAAAAATTPAAADTPAQGNISDREAQASHNTENNTGNDNEDGEEDEESLFGDLQPGVIQVRLGDLAARRRHRRGDNANDSESDNVTNDQGDRSISSGDGDGDDRPCYIS